MHRYNQILAAVVLAIVSSARADDIPDVVVAQAHAFEASGATIAVSPGWPDVLHEYANTFFRSFLNGWDGDEHSASALVREAWAAGQAYRHGHPDQFDAILRGYGFTHVQADGTWSFGWETSRFVPDGGGRETWYVQSLGAASWAQLGWIGRLPDGGARTHVAGWLSKATGRTVSMGGDDRLLMATTVMRGLPDPCLGPLSLGGAAPRQDVSCP